MTAIQTLLIDAGRALIAVQTFRDHLDDLLKMWEEDHELDDPADARKEDGR